MKSRRILITRPVHQSKSFAEEVKAHGGIPVMFPVIKITDPVSWFACDRAIKQCSDYHIIIFASMNAVESFLRRYRTYTGQSFLASRSHTICAVGRGTAKILKQHQLQTHIIPSLYSAKGLLKVLPRKIVQGKRILIPRTSQADDLLPHELRKRGADVDLINVYRTSMIPFTMQELRLTIESGVDIITLTSAESARALLSRIQSIRMRQLIDSIPIYTIGASTAKAVRRYEFVVKGIPSESTIASLARLVCKE